MPKKALKISIVIPAYNEEGHLAACLDAIASQTVKPYEVIVVDNNSTDLTSVVARRYPFVKILNEKKQGPAHARDRGFNSATGDVIGRCDADSILSLDWVERVQNIFFTESVDAISGSVTYRDVGLSKIFDAVDAKIRKYLSRHMQNEMFLYGVNMAVRGASWRRVRQELCYKPHSHEDIDLAAHMAKQGQDVRFMPSLCVSISPRQAASDVFKFLQYVWASPRVYASHGMRSVMYLRIVAATVSTLYLPIHLLYKGYNPATGQFSILYALANNSPPRVSPISQTL